jgi:hypothetical protein
MWWSSKIVTPVYKSPYAAVRAAQGVSPLL